MDKDAELIVSDWIAYIRLGADAPDEVQADGASMYDLSWDDPELTWEVIQRIVQRYPEEELYTPLRTEAQAVVGRVAAGPLEDLLGIHGERFIDRIEAAALADRRFAWALAGMYQFTMTDDVWDRVQDIVSRRHFTKPVGG